MPRKWQIGCLGLEIRFVILYQNIYDCFLWWVWSFLWNSKRILTKHLLSVPFTGGGISAAKVAMCATKAFKASPDPYCTDKWKLFLSQDRANGSALAAKSLQSGRPLVSWFSVSDPLLVLKKLWKIMKWNKQKKHLNPWQCHKSQFQFISICILCRFFISKESSVSLARDILSYIPRASWYFLVGWRCTRTSKASWNWSQLDVVRNLGSTTPQVVPRIRTPQHSVPEVNNFDVKVWLKKWIQNKNKRNFKL